MGVEEMITKPSVTVDAVATREGPNGLELLMIKRGKDPIEWEGHGLPGGICRLWRRSRRCGYQGQC